MPATTPKTKSATKDTTTKRLSQLAAELDDIGDVQAGKIETVHRALFAAGHDREIPPECLPALSLLGDDAAIKAARADALRGRSAVETFKRTKGAQAKAEAAARQRDEKVPGLVEQVRKLEQQIAQLENAPIQHERDAKRHEQAAKDIRQYAPRFIRQQVMAASKTTIATMAAKRDAIKGEHDQLCGWINADMTPHDHRRRGAVDPDGGKPWLLTDGHGRQVVDPQAWRAFLERVNAFERRDELKARLDAIDAEREAADEANRERLDYWLHVHAELHAEN
ncbi:MAG: hypothetical protein WD294_14945 [Phycisphaeraceae bacterium]